MKKHLILILFILFLPHYVIWGTVLLSGFSVDYRQVFNSDGFWAIACTWWALGGMAGIVTRVEPPSGNNHDFRPTP